MKDRTVNRRLIAWSWSEIRQGQLWPISIALTLIIASIFALTALAERMEQVIVKQGKEALTADSVYVSSRPIPQTLLTSIEQLPVESSSMVRFATMAFSDQGMKLVTVKAVESNYPLQGNLRLASATSNQVTSKEAGSVEAGQLWLDERLFAQLDVNVGDVVTIGDADMVVSGRIIEEPGLSFNPFQQMPSVYINRDDLDKTGAIQLGSRVRYSMFINGSDSDVATLKQQTELTPSDRWRDQNSASRTNEVFQRTQQYLSLTVAIVVIMAATTLVLTCQHYVSTRIKTIAMLKSLGATRQWISRWLMTQVLILLGGASLLGLFFGVLLEYLLRYPLVDLLPNPLPSYGMTPMFIALATSILIAIPALGIPLLSLLNVSAINVLQAEATSAKAKSARWLVLVPLIPLVVIYSDNPLVWMVLGGIIGLFGLLALFSVLVMRVLGKVRLSTAFTLAMSRINRSPFSTGIQFGALALSLMLLATMWLVRTDVLDDWQRTVPEDAPNAFALNIAPYEKDAYVGFLDQNQIERSQAYPIVRGRLSTINGVDAKTVAKGGEGTDALSREINFTYANQIPQHNELVRGQWTKQGGVSVESDVAADLGLKIGDSLSFVINSQTVTAQVNSIRHVEWRDMKPNFYFIFSPDVLATIPATYLLSFRVQDQHNDLLNDLSRQFPTVSLMDIRVMGAKIQELLSQIAWSITVLAALGVIAGMLLIFTLLRLSIGQRQSEIQLYRTLGASKKRIVATIWAEYGLMALVASITATLGAETVVAGLMRFGFEMLPSLHFSLWICLPILTFFTLALVVNSLVKRLLVPINKEVL
ncbi:ABC transporter permease [Vibrio sinensis]|uniref:ABC transporter permease n=1 Tax=Vibrio sinensis TaxID=2302434 RepID=A0A3A6QW82_9VIBR|nr:ABC transporter permease [Vibrio sinensis]RJX75528.1 ABC transporter permease [Vibrio sinensis]